MQKIRKRSKVLWNKFFIWLINTILIKILIIKIYFKKLLFSETEYKLISFYFNKKENLKIQILKI